MILFACFLPALHMRSGQELPEFSRHGHRAGYGTHRCTMEWRCGRSLRMLDVEHLQPFPGVTAIHVTNRADIAAPRSCTATSTTEWG